MQITMSIMILSSRGSRIGKGIFRRRLQRSENSKVRSRRMLFRFSLKLRSSSLALLKLSRARVWMLVIVIWKNQALVRRDHIRFFILKERNSRKLRKLQSYNHLSIVVCIQPWMQIRNYKIQSIHYKTQLKRNRIQSMFNFHKAIKNRRIYLQNNQ